MGCCCSSDLQVEQTRKSKSKAKTEKERKQSKARAKAVKDLIYYLEDPNSTHKFKFPEFSRKEIDTKSMLSAKTGASMVFPKLSDVEILTHTPAKPGTYVKIEDSFWPEKRKLIPDYSVMEKIDDHVLKAKDSLRNDAVKLVEYLMKPCKNEVQKARAIIRWMGENVQYDTNFLETGTRGDQSAEAVLRTGRAVCDGYGTAFSHLGNLAGLECRKISGQTKGAGYYPGCFDPQRLSAGPGAHAWNAVKINGKWYLSDATWAAGSTGSNGGKRVFNKKWNECYFLSDPTYFVLAHIPLEGDSIIADDQLLNDPITDPVVWAELALVTPQAGVYGIRPVSHKSSVIETSTGEIAIQFVCRVALDHFVSVERIEKHGNSVMKYTGKTIDNMVALFTLEGRSLIMARFQQEGTYDVQVWGGIKNGHPALAVNTKMLSYRVHAKQKSQFRPLPYDTNHRWGIQQQFIDAGYAVKYPKGCIIKAKNGLAIIKIQLPSDGILPNLFKLLYSNKKGATGTFEDYVIVGRRGNKALYFVQCPHAGEYKLQIYAKYQNIEMGYGLGAAFLIECTAPAKNLFKVDTNKSFLGIEEHFINMGLTTSAKNTILKVKKGQARLRIKKTKPAQLLPELKSSDMDLSYCSGVDTQENGNIVTFTITPPSPGFYVLNIFASPPNQSSLAFAARFGVNFDANI